MMEQAKMETNMRENLWAEATRTATYLDNITPNSANDKMMSSDFMWYAYALLDRLHMWLTEGNSSLNLPQEVTNVFSLDMQNAPVETIIGCGIQ